jgi:Ca-activated chloride channel homolog
MTTEPTASLGGLRTTAGVLLPLEAVDVTGEVLAAHARVRVTQRWRNTETTPVEAIYTFPLPSDATLVGFTMKCDGRLIEGVVKEREQAFADYDRALTAGHGAALLDQERPNVFTAQVGNLLPGEETLVEVEYLQRVTADEGALRWSIPTLVAPRYIPGVPAGDRTAHGVADPTDRVPDADRISPPRTRDVAYRLSLDVTFDVGEGAQVESPSHAISVSRSPADARKTRVQLTSVALDRDIVIVARNLGREALTTVSTHRDGAEPGVFALTIVPDLFDAKRKLPRQDVVFLIDVSGSMDGSSIDEARAALRLGLRHLREGDRFNVLAFNESIHPFSSAPAVYSQSSLERADAWVTALRANGGTELLAPLVEAVTQVPDGVVVLLTDGQVGNEQEILARVLEIRKSTRIFCFGIGTNISDALLRDLARRSDGGLELIHPGERIDEKVVSVFARAVAERVRDVTLSFEGVEPSELAPAEPRPLVDGEPWVVFGRYDKPAIGCVHVRGTLHGEKWHQRIPLELPDRQSQPMLLKLWARERIRDLEDAELSPRRQTAMRARIVELAVRHGLATAYTSFVVVEKREGDRRNAAQPAVRVVPVGLPAGWAMFAPQAQANMLTQAGLLSTQASFGAGGMPRPPMPMAMPAGAPMGRGAPPSPMSMSAPMPARAPSAPQAPASASGAKSKGSFFAPVARAVKSVLGASREQDEGAIAPPSAMAPAPALHDLALEAEEQQGAGPGGDPVVALLSRQLVSGLWAPAGGSTDDLAVLEVSTRALLELLRASLTTAHPVHGEQVRKAVVAIVQAAERLASKHPRAAELALGVAWLLASGRRTRGQVESVASTAVPSLSPRLTDEVTLRRHVDALAAAP